jgi:hypothetical protein
MKFVYDVEIEFKKKGIKINKKKGNTVIFKTGVSYNIIDFENINSYSN